MTGFSTYRASETPLLVDVLESGTRARTNAVAGYLGKHIALSTAALESYFFADWKPKLYDLLVVAAASEFCDQIQRRPGHGWARNFDVRIAVHDAAVWSAPEVCDALIDTLNFLTGDVWRFRFEERRTRESPPKQSMLPLSPRRSIIMPFSEGLDSLAVYTLANAGERDELVRVRLGKGGVDAKTLLKDRLPFARVPYGVSAPKRPESSARSRGFKFAVVTAIAASLSKVSRIVVTESGQGALGPVLLRSSHAYPDYRVHPAFSRKMEHLFAALTGDKVEYEYPRLWHTKGETLAEAARLPDAPDFLRTRSCWQSAQQVSVDKSRRQCGVCAACMLRRVSMLTAGLNEPRETYVWEDLDVAEFNAGAAPNFRRHTGALQEHGIAGVLFMDNLAKLAEAESQPPQVRRVGRLTADALGTSEDEVAAHIQALLERHAEEWRSFVGQRAAQSFVRRFASSVAA
jgi:7-cyano-7-deazaguanine synthase in queuosine biosynthesis